MKVVHRLAASLRLAELIASSGAQDRPAAIDDASHGFGVKHLKGAFQHAFPTVKKAEDLGSSAGRASHDSPHSRIHPRGVAAARDHSNPFHRHTPMLRMIAVCVIMANRACHLRAARRLEWLHSDEVRRARAECASAAL
jgi:hypothetical protein